MPLPVVKEDIKASLFRRVMDGLKGHPHKFFEQEAERIRSYNPVIISAIEFFSDDDTIAVETQNGTSLADMPPEIKNGISRRVFDLAIKVYLLLESQAEVDDMEKEIRLG